MAGLFAPALVFAYGNPSRGDDALGPEFARWLATEDTSGQGFSGVELLTDFQLQLEHTLDMLGRRLVLFVDASASGPDPYAFFPVQAERDFGYTSHALAPATLLAVFQGVHAEAPPPSFVLAIRGYGFELGEPLSAQARSNLEAAKQFAERLLTDPDPLRWSDLCGEAPKAQGRFGVAAG
ncbi:MAG: hydrogenase maturation protease [Pseudomonadota bacterium]|nr:hydrogenase maturation protease [Pseudomonadota bacterium]